jgi:hypothetical protein
MIVKVKKLQKLLFGSFNAYTKQNNSVPPRFMHILEATVKVVTFQSKGQIMLRSPSDNSVKAFPIYFNISVSCEEEQLDINFSIQLLCHKLIFAVSVAA